MSRRIGFATLSALLGLVVSVVAFGRAPGAIATQGQPVVAGQSNTATSSTGIFSSGVGFGLEVTDGGGISAGTSSPGHGEGLKGQGGVGAWGLQTGSAVDGAGVLGFGTAGAGVVGESQTNNGVFGTVNTATTSGVYGQNDGAGFSVAGRANQGTGVLADSTNGTALAVNGKALPTGSPWWPGGPPRCPGLSWGLPGTEDGSRPCTG